MSFLLFIFFLPRLCASENIMYECGEHGKFEYCIDEIPGCVIGCYCHPGYYFDTESKICEHNSKLTQSRRRFNPEPVIDSTPVVSVTEVLIKPTTKLIETEASNTQSDNGDLSDWLYNQFFKTIENQVINNTEVEELPTRRKGIRKNKQKLKKKKRRSLKKNNKKMRRKALRITEDDSVFDDDDDDDDTDDDDSDDSDDDTSSSESSETDDVRKKTRYPKSHKKFIMIQKKPKPQLPSFIFLPSGDTPFYPPIGLPPPPAMPMYPMIPVPPVFLVANTSASTDGNKNTATVQPTTIEESFTEKTSQTTSTTDAVFITDAVTTENSDKSKTNENSLRHPMWGVPDVNPKNAKLNRGTKSKHESKKKLKYLHNLMRQTMKNKKDSNFNAFGTLERPQETAPNDNFVHNNIKPKPSQDYDVPKGEDVDFKYLTDLIHKIDSNMPKNSPMLHFSPNDSIGMQESYLMSPEAGANLLKRPNLVNLTIDLPDIWNKTKLARRFDTRRKFHDYNEADDSFYSNLGRQIASLIRKADISNGAKLTIELENNKEQDANYDEFYDNRYAPRSYWERSVRSPYLKVNKEKLDYIDESNQNLFDLENRVKIAASTKPTFSLHQLENIINTIEKTKSSLQNKGQSVNRTKANMFDNRKKKIAVHKTLALDLHRPVLLQPEANYNKNYYEIQHNLRNASFPKVISNKPDTSSTERKVTPTIKNSFVLRQNYIQPTKVLRIALRSSNKNVISDSYPIKTQFYPAGTQSVYSSVIRATAKPFRNHPYSSKFNQNNPTRHIIDDHFLLFDGFDDAPQKPQISSQHFFDDK